MQTLYFHSKTGLAAFLCPIRHALFHAQKTGIATMWEPQEDEGFAPYCMIVQPE